MNKKIADFLLVVFLFLNMNCSEKKGRIKISEMMCEYSVNPSGVETQHPKLNWKLSSSERNQVQTAYEVLVASSIDLLNKDIGDKWESGIVKSDQSIHIRYNGGKLTSTERYFWKVRVWYKNNTVSAWSKPAYWEMGLLHKTDWKAKWIGYESKGNPVLRKEFKIDKGIEKATTYISGLGYYELSINGRKIGDHVLDPGQTDYESRTFYVIHDVTGNILQGKNAIGVELGNGFYNQTTVNSAYYGWGNVVYGKPRAILQLHIKYNDGTDTLINSDTDWKATSGPTIYNNLYEGDFYDARLELPGWNMPDYDDSGWEQVTLMESPGGKLVSQKIQPCKRMKTLKPVKIHNPQKRVYVYDMGQNFAGWARLKLKAPKGTEIVLRFSEEIFEDGNVNFKTTGGAATGVTQTDKYICKGSDEGEIWEPRFTYHGFRYVEMTGFPGVPTLDNLEGIVVYSALEDAGSFECSDTILNRIHKAVYWTHISNMHSFFEDCPHREKCGWLGDVMPEVSMLYFDAPLLITKYERDIETSRISPKPVKALDVDADSVSYENIPWAIAPGRRVAQHRPDWVSKYIHLPWFMYIYYNDLSLIHDMWEGMDFFMKHLEIIAKEYIIHKGYGDMSQPRKIIPDRLPVDQTSTALYFYNSKLMASMAQLIGKTSEADYYDKLSQKIKNAFNAKYYDKEKKWYGSQTLSSMAIDFGLVPDGDDKKVAKNIAQDVTQNHKGHFSTGQMGSRYLYNILGRYGYGDVAKGILDKTNYPGIGYLIYEHGATTFWEVWEPNTGNSHNHPFQTGCGDWLMKGIGGIHPDEDNPGFKNVILKTDVSKHMQWANASYKSIYGTIQSTWRTKGDEFTWEVSVPVNTSATIYLPTDETANIFESGQAISTQKDIEFIRMDGDFAVYQVGSGAYNFKVGAKHN